MRAARKFFAHLTLCSTLLFQKVPWLLEYRKTGSLLLSGCTSPPRLHFDIPTLEKRLILHISKQYLQLTITIVRSRPFLLLYIALLEGAYPYSHLRIAFTSRLYFSIQLWKISSLITSQENTSPLSQITICFTLPDDHFALRSPAERFASRFQTITSSIYQEYTSPYKSRSAVSPSYIRTIALLY